MKYRKLGNCGARVSVIGLGSWLTLGGTVDIKTGRSLLKAAYDGGINFFDTADVYALGNAEKFLGEGLKSFPRRNLFIASKCYWPMSENPNDRGLSRKHIFESVDQSLKNLKTDYIDLYQCHRYDKETPVEETCRAYNSLIEKGKILYWGVSEWTAEQIREAVRICEKNNLHRPVSDQPQYSLLSRDIERDGVVRYCEKEGIGLVVWSPLAQGVLTGKYNSKTIENKSRLKDKKNNTFVRKFASGENLIRVGKLVELARKAGTTASNIALQWCMRKQIVSSAITSATKISQLKENLKAGEMNISPDVISEADKIFNLTK